MKNFNYKKRNLTSGPHLFGSLLVSAGLFALVSPSFLESGSSIERILAVGIGAIIIGLLIVSFYSGTLIDFTQKRYKEYSSLCGFKFGEWSVLPNVSKVKVIAKTYVSTNTPNGVSPTFSGRVTDYKTLIFSDSSIPFLSFEYTKKDMAVKHAEQLAANLNVNLELNLP